MTLSVNLKWDNLNKQGSDNTEHMHSQGMYLALYVQDLIESHQKILTVWRHAAYTVDKTFTN